MERNNRLIDPPRDPREPPTDEPIPPEERARRMATPGRGLLQLARRAPTIGATNRTTAGQERRSFSPSL